MHYDTKGERLVRAQLHTYLLAKSRVVRVPLNEENYHVFHSLAAADHHTRAEAGFTPNVYLSRFLGAQSGYGGAYVHDGAFCLDHLLKGLSAFDVSDFQQQEILSILSGILLLDLIQFEAVEQEKTSSMAMTRVVNREVCDTICSLWKLATVDGATSSTAGANLERALTTRQIRDTLQILDVDKARQAVESLAKNLYEALFFFIVTVIRTRLEVESLACAEKSCMDECIGVLDLFGFENMNPGSSNGFEQFCINFANEQLHAHFMRQTIAREIELYTEEAIELPPSSFGDPAQIIVGPDALALLVGQRGNAGIFALLEETSCLSVRNTDPNSVFCRRVNKLVEDHRAGTRSPGKKRKLPVTPCSEHRTITVDHFAEPVTYDVSGFCERNQDHVSDGKSCLCATTIVHNSLQI